MVRATAVIGVSDHAGWAVLVTVAGGAVIDRRRVELVDADLPCMPHHHDAQGLPDEVAIALVERVTASAEQHARACLDALAREVAATIVTIALRACPELPPTIPERIADYRAMCVADWVMYRRALAGAAKAKRWRVSWYDAKEVMRPAGIEARVRAAGKALGPPWRADHKVAMAAAIAATG
jgi:hypothetical protein